TAAVPASLIAISGNATITVVNPGATVSNPLTFTITPPGTLIVTPTSLIFTYQSATTPSSQNLSVSSSGSPVGFIATAQSITPADVNWLSVSPASGTPPSNLTVSLVNTSGLAPGTYSGAVTVSLPDNTGTQKVNVTLTVAGPPF